MYSLVGCLTISTVFQTVAIFHTKAQTTKFSESCICRPDQPVRIQTLACTTGSTIFVKRAAFLYQVLEELDDCCESREFDCSISFTSLDFDVIVRQCSGKENCTVQIPEPNPANRRVCANPGPAVPQWTAAFSRIEYDCRQNDLDEPTNNNLVTDEENSAGDTTGSGGNAGIIIASVVCGSILVVGIVIIVILYRRRLAAAQGRAPENNTNEHKTAGNTNIATATESDYSTIPADYADTDDVIKRNDVESGYTTVIASADSPYNKASYNSNMTSADNKAGEPLNTYSQTNEAADDYNKLELRHGHRVQPTDPAYSHLCQNSNQYSHLHMNSAKTDHETESDYNHADAKGNLGLTTEKGHAQERDITSTPFDRVCDDQTGSGVFTSSDDGRLSKPYFNPSKADDYETPVLKPERKDSSETTVRTRTGSYESPVLKVRESYESFPLKGKDTCESTAQNGNGSYESPVLKRKNSYESPVLSGNARHESSVLQRKNSYE